MNRKGFLRIVEASISILIILGVLLTFYARGVLQDQQPDYAEKARDILEELSRDDVLRAAVLADDIGTVNAFTGSKIQESFLNYDVNICDVNVVCGNPSGFVDEDVFVGERLISSSYGEADGDPGVCQVSVEGVSSDSFPISGGETSGTLSGFAIPSEANYVLVGISSSFENFEEVFSVEYGGMSLTFLGAVSAEDDARVEIWELKEDDFPAPAGDPHDLVVDFTNELQKGAIIGIAAFSNVDQIDSLRTQTFIGHPYQTEGGGGGLPNTEFYAANACDENFNQVREPGDPFVPCDPEWDLSTAQVSIDSAINDLIFSVVACEGCAFLTDVSGQDILWVDERIDPLGEANLDAEAGILDGVVGSIDMAWTLSFHEDWAIGAVSMIPDDSCVEIGDRGTLGPKKVKIFIWETNS